MSYAVVRRVSPFAGLTGLGVFAGYAVLKMGDTGPQVMELQKALISVIKGSTVTVTGTFEAYTKAGVMNIQGKAATARGQTVINRYSGQPVADPKFQTGIADAQFWADLDTAIGALAQANYSKAMYAALPAPVQAAEDPAVIAARIAAQQAEDAELARKCASGEILCAGASPSGETVKQRCERGDPMIAPGTCAGFGFQMPSKPAVSAPPSVAPPASVAETVRQRCERGDPTLKMGDCDFMLIVGATPPRGTKQLVSTPGGPLAWWGVQSTPMKVAVVGGGVLVLLLLVKG